MRNTAKTFRRSTQPRLSRRPHHLRSPPPYKPSAGSRPLRDISALSAPQARIGVGGGDQAMREPASPLHPPGRHSRVGSSRVRPPVGTISATAFPRDGHLGRRRARAERAHGSKARPDERVARPRRPPRALRHRTPTPQRNDDSARVKSRTRTGAVGVLAAGASTTPTRPPRPRSRVTGFRPRRARSTRERARRGRSGLPGFGVIGGFLQSSLSARRPRGVATWSRLPLRSRARRLLA
ncbi:MAG: hypothetical protein ACI8XM_000052 [Haloarculaceae archaeon]